MEEFEFTKRLPSGKVMGFLHMKWKPCNIAIDDLRGYYVSLIIAQCFDYAVWILLYH